MRKIISSIVLMMGLTICISGCSFFLDKGDLKGYIGKEEHFDKKGFQDYTDYCKYFYDAESATLFYIHSNI